MVGCGADSDLLRDQNIDDTPTGNVYKLLNKGIYQYKKIDGKYLGFDYYILDEECKKDSCALLHREYTIFDGNITQQIDQKHIILSGNGWYEKSKISECEVLFGDSNITVRCPDGRVETLIFEKKDIAGKKIIDTMNTVIEKSDLKDESSKFTTSAILYNTDRVNEGKRYEFIQNDSSKCYGENHSSLTDATVSNSSMVCSLDSQIFLFGDTNKSNGTLKIVNSAPEQEISATWRRIEVFGHYTLLEIKSQDLVDTFFVSHYNGATYIGKIIQEENTEKYLNKDGFNAIYTQLSDKHALQSPVKKDLEKGLYRLLTAASTPVYQKISFVDMTHIHVEYGAFFDTKPAANWILTDKGLHRESEECKSDIFFNTFRYQCDDGRDGVFVRIKNTKLPEMLIYTYLLKHSLDYKLDDNDTFFSMESEEISYRETSSTDVYRFAPADSLMVGNGILENNASSLFDHNLFVSSHDKRHYLKILAPKLDANGTVEVYELNSSIELNSTTENNSTFIARHIQKIGTVGWKYKKLGENETIIIDLGNSEKKYFDYSNTMILTVFKLSKTKIIAGELYREKGEPKEISYIDYDAYKDIESAILE
jgi:hypothetical protein